MNAERVALRMVEIVYSPDDGGWYAARLDADLVTVDIYPTHGAVVEAVNSGRAQWER